MTNNIQDVAWGAPLKDASTTIVVSGTGTGMTGPFVQYVNVEMDGAPTQLTYTYSKPFAVINAISRLKAMTDKLEADIAYFNTFKGQGMAINKFGVMKLDLKEIVEMLER